MATDDDLRAYLDDAIRAWRDVRDRNIGRGEEFTAACYIDAFQSVRAFSFGKILPGGKNEDRLVVGAIDDLQYP